MQKVLPKKILRKLARAHLLFSATLFAVYLILSLIYSPEFLLSDIRAKFSALADEAIAVTAKVLSPPLAPIVSGSAVCTGENLSVLLDWPDDENSATFDIDRDGLPLIINLSDSNYSDTAVTVDTTYNYIVTARGPMGPGFATSEIFYITTPVKCAPDAPEPTIVVTSFAERSISSYDGTPHTADRKPEFSGTTNIPNANLTIFINHSPLISAQITANANGFWSWRPPIKISDDTHTLLITASDPLDLSRTVSTNFTFRIDNPSEKEETTSVSNQLPPSSTSIMPTKTAPEYPAVIPLDFSLTLQNDEVFQGQKLLTVLQITRLAVAYAEQPATVHYRIFDEKNKEVVNLLDKNILLPEARWPRDIPLPGYLEPGRYRAQVEIIFADYNVSREQFFQILPAPILKLGGNLVWTYPKLLSRLGTIAFWLLLALLLWFLLFYREYWLYLHALRHITENNLKKVGLFGLKKRKEVSR